jgi:hypothetical protein
MLAVSVERKIGQASRSRRPMGFLQFMSVEQKLCWNEINLIFQSARNPLPQLDFLLLMKLANVGFPRIRIFLQCITYHTWVISKLQIDGALKIQEAIYRSRFSLEYLIFFKCSSLYSESEFHIEKVFSILIILQNLSFVDLYRWKITAFLNAYFCRF